jgi:hypothetical protein
VKIYVASSWKTVARQQLVVWSLREAGHTVYDFRNPESSFSWKQAASEEQLRDPRRFRDEVLTHPLAKAGFEADMGALRSADATVLVLPCGRSAHLELGWAAGVSQRTIVLLDDPVSEPELMYLACTHICVTVAEVVEALAPTPWVPDRPTEKDYIPDGF